MSYRFTLMGLPFSGKTTLFNLLTKTGGSATKKGNLHIGCVDVPDKRLDVLGDIFHSKKIVPARLEFIDIDASTEKIKSGIGETLIGQIRASDAIVVVIADFDNNNPLKDIENVHLELLTADLEIAQKRLLRLNKDIERGLKDSIPERDIVKQCVDHLSNEMFLNELDISLEDQKKISSFSFLTLKPIIHVLTVSEEKLASPINPLLEKLVSDKKSTIIRIAGKIELELSELAQTERQEFMNDLNITDSPVPRFIRAAYDVLNVVTFLTTGEDESRAWTITKGTPARLAAGKIHSDIERGFIRAEVVPYTDIVLYKSFSIARDKGLLRLEGKDYIVQEGDIINFRFNV